MAYPATVLIEQSYAISENWDCSQFLNNEQNIIMQYREFREKNLLSKGEIRSNMYFCFVLPDHEAVV